jgi:hypothetical protein
MEALYIEALRIKALYIEALRIEALCIEALHNILHNTLY